MQRNDYRDIESHAGTVILIFLTVPSAGLRIKSFPIVKEWQERPLEEVYAVVFMDAIHYHVEVKDVMVKRSLHLLLASI